MEDIPTLHLTKDDGMGRERRWEAGWVPKIVVICGWLASPSSSIGTLSVPLHAILRH
jgi:hypothetical protein